MATVAVALNNIRSAANNLTYKDVFDQKPEDWADFLKCVTTCKDIPPHSKNPYRHPTENWSHDDWALYQTLCFLVTQREGSQDYIFKANNIEPPRKTMTTEQIYLCYKKLPTGEMEGIGY